jgi:hypothetical protein
MGKHFLYPTLARLTLNWVYPKESFENDTAHKCARYLIPME